MLKRLRLRLVCITMAIVTLMLCTIFATLFYMTRSNLQNQSLQLMRAAAGAPAAPDRPTQPGRRPEQPDRLPMLYYVFNLNADGTLTLIENPTSGEPDAAMLAALADAAASTTGESGELPGYALRFCRVNTPDGQRLVAADISGEHRALAVLTRTCLLVGLAALGVFFLVSLLLAKWAVRPAERAWQQQMQFVSDASHELKTPLTVITTSAELLQSPGYSPEEQAQFSGSILTMARQMRGLVEDLLDLARADNGAAVRLVPLNFSQLTAEALLPFEPLFFEQSLQLETQLEDGLTVLGSQQQLCQLMGILLDNARKYAAAPGWVSLRLARSGRGHCQLTVSNSGEDIPPAELKQLFLRFYRRDASRSSEGYGLGLSIAERIVRTHHGRIWAESSGGSVRFHVTLPLAPQK